MHLLTKLPGRAKPVTAAKAFILFLLCAFNQSICQAQIPGMSKLSVQLLLNLNGGSHNTADGLVAVFAPGFSTAIGNEDSYKFNNIDENIAINRNGTNLSIEGRPAILANDTLPLKMWQYRQNTYCLKVDGSGFSSTLTAVVKDAYLHQDFSIDLAGGTVIAFNLTTDSASFAADRFCIVFKSSAVLPVVLSDAKAYTKDKGVEVNWVTRSETDIHNFEIERSINGTKFDKVAVVQPKGNSTVAQNYSWYDANAASGNNYYRIKMTDQSGVAKYSGVLKVNVGNATGDFSVFPNPVKGNVLGLHLANMEKGRYTLNLYNNQGQKVYNGLIEHSGGSGAMSFAIDKKIIPGIYTLRLSKDGQLVNHTILFQ